MFFLHLGSHKVTFFALFLMVNSLSGTFTFTGVENSLAANKVARSLEKNWIVFPNAITGFGITKELWFMDGCLFFDKSVMYRFLIFHILM